MVHSIIYPESSPLASNTHSCYFTYLPPSSANHWSTETPLESPQLPSNVRPDPHNPFLAAREPPAQLSPLPQYTMDVSRLMQLQSAAAHGSADNSSSRSSSTSSGRSSASSESVTPVIQGKSCSRCQTTYGSFVSYALNSYYCTRCAKLVGYNT